MNHFDLLKDRCSATSQDTPVPSVARFKSDFAILDVKQGRKALYKQLVQPHAPDIPVTIQGHIVGVWGHDDGISQEFEVTVSAVFTSPPTEPVNDGTVSNTDAAQETTPATGD